jgi:predicted HD phosphohydrolase
MTEVAQFRQMIDGSRADYEIIARHEHEYSLKLPERILESLQRLDGEHGMGGYPVSRYEHSLQSATRALRDGADIEYVVAALIHDIGDDLSPYNHSDIAAAILKPYVRAEVTWVIQQHGLFQSYYFAHHFDKNRNGRDRFKDHPWYAACVNFCERWDQAAFDPDYQSEPLSTFEPMVREVFLRQAHDPIFTTGT